jgi:raffinose/stachyose/melibiose transport system permease protein
MRRLPQHAILWVVGIFVVGPLIYGVISGFKSTAQLSSNMFGLPSPWVTSNYTAARRASGGRSSAAR